MYEKIDSLNELDSGFDMLFKAVKEEITENPDEYRESIVQMQGLIAAISELGVSIQALENQNSMRFKAFLAKERKMIREFNVNSRTATNYYQNMTNVKRPEQSYFFNEKKIPQTGIEYGSAVTVHLMVPSELKALTDKQLAEITAGKASPEWGDEVSYGLVDEEVISLS